MRLKRQIPGVDSSSSADIAFLLLIFFLLTSSIQKEQSFSQSLPEKKEQKKTPTEVRKRDMFELSILADNTIVHNGVALHAGELKKQAKEFIVNENDDPNLPQRQVEDIPHFGQYQITPDHLFLLKISRSASYQTYIHVQNTIIAAYNELRNETAVKKWEKGYASLSYEQKEAIQQIYPYRIAETELKEPEPNR